MTIADNEIINFGGLKITQSADGYGTSGVCTSELMVTIPTWEYESWDIPPNAKVVLSCGYGYAFAPTFYIMSRSKKGGCVSFKCGDRMIFTDQQAVISDAQYTDKKIESQWLVQAIAAQCGFNGWGIGGTVTEVPTVYLTKEYISGKTCRNLLETVSAAWCGYFKVSNGNVLIFIPFGSKYHLGSQALNHATVVEGGSKGPIECVIMTDGTKTYISGNENADMFRTIKLSSDFATQELAGQIFKRIKDCTYEAWSCSKCIIDYGLGDVEIDAEINFADGSTRIANYIEKIPTAAGIFCKCGRNDVTESEFDYTGKLSREIQKRIADGEKLGNGTMITRYQGIVHLGKETNDEQGNKVQNRYGYSEATADGVVQFDGAMVDSVLPKVMINSDLSAVNLEYEGKKYELELAWDGDNVSIKQKEEAT